MRKFHRNALTALILGNLAIVPAYALAQDAAPPQDAAAAQEEPAGEAGDDVTELQAVVVSGEIMYRHRNETTAPERVYGQEFFAEFAPVRSEERRVGKESVRQCRSGGQPYA